MEGNAARIAQERVESMLEKRIEIQSINTQTWQLSDAGYHAINNCNQNRINVRSSEYVTALKRKTIYVEYSRKYREGMNNVLWKG